MCVCVSVSYHIVPTTVRDVATVNAKLAYIIYILRGTCRKNGPLLNTLSFFPLLKMWKMWKRGGDEECLKLYGAIEQGFTTLSFSLP